MLYSYKNQWPQVLPFRIRLSDGRTRTDPSTFTPDELDDAGYVPVSDPPQLQDNEKLLWNDITGAWIVTEYTPEELEMLKQTKWKDVRQQRNILIQSVAWRVERYNRYLRLGLTPIDDILTLENYIQELADIPQTQQDPFNIIWPSLHVVPVESVNPYPPGFLPEMNV